MKPTRPIILSLTVDKLPLNYYEAVDWRESHDPERPTHIEATLWEVGWVGYFDGNSKWGDAQEMCKVIWPELSDWIVAHAPDAVFELEEWIECDPPSADEIIDIREQRGLDPDDDSEDDEDFGSESRVYLRFQRQEQSDALAKALAEGLIPFANGDPDPDFRPTVATSMTHTTKEQGPRRPLHFSEERSEDRTPEKCDARDQTLDSV
jgi:hypothetical protein